MSEHDPGQLSDALRAEADELERDGVEVQRQIEETRQDWERKRADDSVPGAPPPEAQEHPQATADEEEPPEASGKG